MGVGVPGSMGARLYAQRGPAGASHCHHISLLFPHQRFSAAVHTHQHPNSSRPRSRGRAQLGSLPLLGDPAGPRLARTRDAGCCAQARGWGASEASDVLASPPSPLDYPLPREATPTILTVTPRVTRTYVHTCTRAHTHVWRSALFPVPPFPSHTRGHAYHALLKSAACVFTQENVFLNLKMFKARSKVRTDSLQEGI